MTREGAAEDIQACLDAFTQEHAEASVEWDFIAGNLAWTTPTQTPADEPLVVAVRDAAELVLGAPPPLGTFPGGTDAIWWQGWAGIPTIPAFGPGLLPQCHRPDESVSVDELTRAAMIYALTIHRYLRRSEP
jgi:acetylornithine deacetylase/succinyl-diaminopimelate desuccinylase-like protein